MPHKELPFAEWLAQFDANLAGAVLSLEKQTPGKLDSYEEKIHFLGRMANLGGMKEASEAILEQFRTQA